MITPPESRSDLAPGQDEAATKDHGQEIQDQDTPTDVDRPDRVLSPEHRADLHASAITEAALAEAGVWSHPSGRGWALPWHDDRQSFSLLVYDRDKRPADGRKNNWPKGQTAIVNHLREVDSARVLVVEGNRQQLAALSYAPPDMSVYGINGADGIHRGIADRLGWASGKHVALALDADHATNKRVAGAVERVSTLLRDAGAITVRLVDLNGHKQADNDGLDDVLARVPEDKRAGVLSDLIRNAREARHPRTQAILDAALDAADLDAIPEPEPLLSGLLNRSEYVMLAGKFATYKSFVALAWSFALATGKPWSAHTVPEPRPVVYVAAEGMAGIRKRLRALERQHGVSPGRGMFTLITRPVRLANPEEMAGLRAVVERTGAGLVVLDTWHRLTPGIEENSATDTGGPLDAMLGLRDDYGCTVLLVHHTGHEQRHGRGSSALEDDADAAWLIRLGKEDNAENRGLEVPRTLIQRKAKDGEIAAPVVLRLVKDDQGDATVEADLFASPPALEARRGRPAKTNDQEAAVKELIGAMDEAGLSLTLGADKVAEWDAARRPGRSATRAVIREAVAARRGRAGETTREAVRELGSPKVAAPLGGDSGDPSAIPSPESASPIFGDPSEQGKRPSGEGSPEGGPGVSATPLAESGPGFSATPDAACPRCGGPTCVVGTATGQQVECMKPDCDWREGEAA